MKLSQEFSRTESRILGALYKLDESLLKPQRRTLSGTVPEKSQSNDTENREPIRDRYQNDLYPELVFSVCRSNNSIDSYQEDKSHIVTGVQDDIPCCSTGTASGKHKKARSTSQPLLAARTLLRQMKQTTFCQPFNNWQATAILPTLTLTSTGFQKCPNPSRQ